MKDILLAVYATLMQPGEKISIKRCSLLVTLLLIGSVFCSGQSGAKLSLPELSFMNNRLIVKYDILDANSSDKFNVEMEVRAPDGSLIPAESVYGDLGENISGTKGRQIIWDIAADEIKLNQDISVELYATPAESLLINGTLEGEPPAGSVEQTTQAAAMDKNSNMRTVTMGNAMLLSALVPGLGISRISNGKPYWIAGITSYSCLASGLTFYFLKENNYNKYMQSDLTSSEDPNFLKAEQREKISYIFLWSALGVWVADLGFTWLQANRLKQVTTGTGVDHFSISTAYDYVNHSQSFGVIYTF